MIAVAERTFPSARSELPMLYVLLTLGTIELLAVHFMVSLWSAIAAWVLSVVTLFGVVQIVVVVRRVKHRPTLLTRDGLLIRSAKGFEVALSWDRIAAVEPIGFGPVPSGDDVLRAELLAHPNVHVTATRPLIVRLFGRPPSAESVTIRVDHPEALIDAARQALGAGATAEQISA